MISPSTTSENISSLAREVQINLTVAHPFFAMTIESKSKLTQN